MKTRRTLFGVSLLSMGLSLACWARFELPARRAAARGAGCHPYLATGVEQGRSKRSSYPWRLLAR